MKWYYRLAVLLNPFFLLFIRIKTRFSGPRVRVVARNSKGEVLLVKSVFGMKAWEFPGGEVGRGESQATAAVRELYEETALTVSEDALQKRQLLESPFPIQLFQCSLRDYMTARIIRPLEMREV